MRNIIKYLPSSYERVVVTAMLPRAIHPLSFYVTFIPSGDNVTGRTLQSFRPKKKILNALLPYGAVIFTDAVQTKLIVYTTSVSLCSYKLLWNFKTT